LILNYNGGIIYFNRGIPMSKKETTVITVTVPVYFKKEIEMAAQDEFMSTAAYVKRAVLDYMKAQKRKRK